MKIAGIYSFNRGQEIITASYAAELEEVKAVITAVDGRLHKTKISKEKTMPGKMLYRPSALNRAFSREFAARKWSKYKVLCDYPSEYYTADYQPANSLRGA